MNVRFPLALAAVLSGALAAQTPADPFPGKKKLLAIGDVRTGYQHESVSHALATIERLGWESGAYVTFIRTDSQWITKDKIERRDPRTPKLGANIHAKNLDYFDAIFFMGSGEGDLTDQQKKDLLAFIHDDGKGFIGAHTADDAFFTWPEWGEMVGGYFDNHPWGVFDAPVIVEDRHFAAMKAFPPAFTIHDEIYVHKAPYKSSNVHILARLDPQKLDFAQAKDLHRTDQDFPVAWTKSYGKGRVFFSTFGHLAETWDNPAIQKMYFEAIKWAIGIKE
jgi:type 1 glutamine amidotransferase